MCGEQPATPTNQHMNLGSSPRVRGTVLHGLTCNHHKGIIPACAGNSINHNASSCCSRDHPRVCGEQTSGILASSYLLGSSPRVRGTASFNLQNSSASGIIPACAGNSPPPCCLFQIYWDHPRVCGEQAWGSTTWARQFGIIPACAGNSFITV